MTNTLKFEVTTEPVPERVVKPRQGKYDPLIEAAKQAAKQSPGSAADGGHPWVVFPANRKPEVGTSLFYNLRDRHADEMEILLTERVAKGNTYTGVLRVRVKGKPRKAGRAKKAS